MAFLVFALLCSCYVVVSSNTVYNLTIAKNGTDNITCLTGDISCLTLDYTINNLPEEYRALDNVTLRIEVRHSHDVKRITTTIESNMDIEIFSEQPNISLCFIKNDDFGARRTITGSQLFTSSYIVDYHVSILFRGLKFHGCHDIGSTEVAPVTMAFNVFTSLEFDHCFVEDGSSLEIIIGDIGQVKITNCVFQHSSFAAGSLSIHYVPFRGNKIDLLIRDNVFVNNTGTGVAYSSIFSTRAQALVFNIPYLYRPVPNVLVVIDNCFITNVTTHADSPLIGIIAENGDRVLNGHFVVRNIDFNGLVSRGDFIAFDLSSSSSTDNNITLDITNCIFTNNILYSAALMSAYIVQSRAKMIISNSSILSNRGSCVHMSADNSPDFELGIHNTLIQNNTDYLLFNLRSLTGLETSVVLNNVSILKNTAKDLPPENTISVTCTNFLLVEANQLNLRVVNSIFKANLGTSLHLTNSNVTFAGINIFQNNKAIRGGAVALYDRAFLLTEERSCVEFDGNSANYGGAIYIASNNNNSCVMDTTDCSSAFSITFNNNVGRIDGNTLYITEREQAECIRNYNTTCKFLDSGLVGTATLHMNFTTNSTEVFPGQNIRFGLTVLNFFDANSVIEVDVNLHCNGEWYNCDDYGYELIGPHIATLTSRANNSPTDYVLKADSEDYNAGNLSLEIFLLGENRFQDALTLMLRPCPNGYAFNKQSGMCECLQLNFKSDYFFCLQRLGIACVAQGVWLGKVNNGPTVVKDCYSRVCNAESQPCPAQVDGVSKTFVLLGQNSDDQCSQNEGGVLCSGCKVNTSFTFEGWSCISSSNCELWHPYVLLVLGLISQLALCMFLLAMLRLKLGFGLGYLYGPVFFLAVVTQLPFRHHTEYSVLRALISIVKSIFFLDLEWLGIIPLCTFDIGKLGNIAFRYIGPVIANLVIIITMVMARKCPKLLAFLQESPVPSICLLLYLSFWSLTETSLTIFYPIFLPTDNTSLGMVHVYLQPDTPYFTGAHIFLVIVATLVFSLLVLPFTLFLTCSPFLARKFNLLRIKPLMDEFQSCYKPRYQWFSATYIIAWICLVYFSLLPSLFQSVLLVVLLTHIILQPYQNRWLNTIDTLLLLNALFVYSLLEQQIPDEKGLQVYKVFLAYLLVILPFLYIFLGIIFIVAQRTGFLGHATRTIRQIKSRAAKKSKKAFVTTTEVSVSELIKSDRTSTTELLLTFGSDGGELREPFLEEVTQFN